MKHKLNAFFKSHPRFSFIGIALLFLFIEGLYSFCSKPKSYPTHNCPAFTDANFDAWFPYGPGTKLFFASTLNKKDTINIIFVGKSIDEPFAPAGACTSYIHINSEPDTTPTHNKLRLGLEKKEGSPSDLLIAFYDFQLTNARLLDNTISPTDTYKSKDLSTVSINGKTFANLTELMRDTTTGKTAGVYKIWVAKGSGIIGYERYPTLEQFAKQ